MNIPMTIMVIGVTLALGANASPGSGDQTHAHPSIETQASSRAHLHVELQRDETWRVYGEVHKTHHGTGVIPGHIEIEVLAADGRVLARTSNRYHHRSRRSRHSWFLVDLPEVGEPVATLRVMHHGAGRSQLPAGG